MATGGGDEKFQTVMFGIFLDAGWNNVQQVPYSISFISE